MKPDNSANVPSVGSHDVLGVPTKAAVEKTLILLKQRAARADKELQLAVKELKLSVPGLFERKHAYLDAIEIVTKMLTPNKQSPDR